MSKKNERGALKKEVRSKKNKDASDSPKKSKPSSPPRRRIEAMMHAEPIDMDFCLAVLEEPHFKSVKELGITRDMLFDEGRKMYACIEEFAKKNDDRLPTLGWVLRETSVQIDVDHPRDPIDAMAKKLHERHVGKTLFRELKAIHNVYREQDSYAAAARFGEAIERMRTAADGGSPRGRLADLRVGAHLGKALEAVQARAEGALLPVPLPWPSLAELLGGGLWPGLYCLVSATGLGKTQWALQAAVCAAEKQVPVLYVGLELGQDEIDIRLLSLMARQKWSHFYRGRMEAEEIASIGKQFAPRLADLPIYVETALPYGWDPRELLPRIEQIRTEHPMSKKPNVATPQRPVLLILDFLQLVEGDSQRDLRERIGRTSYALRRIARDHNVAVLMISSTSRQNAQSADETEEPKKGGRSVGEGNPGRFVGTAKEAGEIEYSANAVLFLGRKYVEGPLPERTRCELAVAKQREGPLGWVPLEFDGTRFEEPRPVTGFRTKGRERTIPFGPPPKPAPGPTPMSNEIEPGEAPKPGPATGRTLIRGKSRRRKS